MPNNVIKSYNKLKGLQVDNSPVCQYRTRLFHHSWISTEKLITRWEASGKIRMWTVQWVKCGWEIQTKICRPTGKMCIYRLKHWWYIALLNSMGRGWGLVSTWRTAVAQCTICSPHFTRGHVEKYTTAQLHKILVPRFENSTGMSHTSVHRYRLIDVTNVTNSCANKQYTAPRV